MPTKDLNYIFNEISLYTKEKFTVLKLDSDNKYDLDISQINLQSALLLFKQLTLSLDSDMEEINNRSSK